jgi:hypothetical protein
LFSFKLVALIIVHGQQYLDEVHFQSFKNSSCVASQLEYGVEDRAGRACDHSRDDAEIDSQLRTQHRQDEEETNEN